MAEKKKKQPAEFAKDKNAFAGGSSKGKDVTTQKSKRKQSGAHQPRDADTTSGHNVQKQENKPEQESFFDSRDSFQGGARKAEGQKAKTKRKKRRQPGQFQKENSFTGNKEKPDSDHAGSKAPDNFSKEQNAFTEEGGGEQAEETDFKDDYRRKDTYHQSEKKGRYRRRERQDRERIKKSDFERDFQTKDATFTKEDTFSKEDTFTEGAEPEFPGSKKSEKLQRKAEKAGKKAETARKKLPKKKEYSLERVFDEKTGRAKYVLTAVVKEKPFKEDNPVKRMAGRAGSEFTNFAHGKVAETEKENSGVEGAHKTEQKAEDTYRFVKRHYKGREQRQREKVAKLEKKQFKKEVNFRYQKFLEENPEMQEKTLKKQLQKRLQKQRIKREYAKAVRTGQAAKNTKEAAVKTANFTTTVAKKLQEMAAKHASLLVTVGACALLLIMIMTSVSSCGAMFSNGMSTTLAGSYMSVPAEIDAADLAFSELEMELQKEIDSIETDYPDYDEYRYNLDCCFSD